MRRLKDLRSALCDNPANQSLALEMDLLVNGFIGDGQVFQSFGYENLYELGFMDYQLWKYFQKQKFDKDITELDDRFCAIDDEEALSTSDSEFGSTTIFVEEAMADGTVKSLTEPLLDIDNETQELFSRPAGTDNPEVYISTALHMTDGPDAYGYSHPSAISDFGQLSGASHESDENVLASLCPPISGKFRTGLEQNLSDSELYPAVRAGDERMVRLLLGYGTDVNGAKPWEDPPLSLAVQAGDEGMVRLLLDRGADVNGGHSWNDPPLCLAVQAGDEGMVRLLLDRGADVNGGHSWRDPPLYTAVCAGDERMVRLLLDHGADVNGGHLQEDPLLFVAVRAGHERMVQLLLDHGTDVNGVNPWGDLPLCLAVQAGDEGMVRLLLDRGADVNGGHSWKDPPLCLAVQAGHEGIVRLLLDHEADVDKAYLRKDPPLSLAIVAGHEGIVQLLREANTKALSMAAKQRNVNCVRRLIREGADVQIAALYLQGEGGNHTQWLLKVAWPSSGATNVGKKKKWQSADSDASENIRHVRLKFVGQYMLMTKSAQNSRTRLRDLPQQFHNYREAWTAGIETMRELSRGEKPSGIYETLAFLSLGRAVAETLRDRKNCDYLEDFERDLGRWGQLFENAADLEAYEDALNLMWGVAYNDPTSREQGHFDEDTLICFRELASTLLSRANDLLGFEAFHDRRSEHYQQSRPKIGQIPIEDVPHRFSDHRSPGAKSPSQIGAAPLQHFNLSNIFDSIKTDTSSVKSVVLLLVFGAIFAIVVMFLEGTSKR
jgi:ankyrin repeat protein